jgi:hypothetical protein
MTRLTLYDTLSTLAWVEQHFGALQTNKQCSRRRVMTAVRKGLAESAGMCTPCGDDGFMLDGRSEREGFRLTNYGREYFKAEEARRMAEFKARFEAVT